MRINNPVFRLGIAVVVIVNVLSPGSPAVAQGFLESLFGVFSPQPKPQRQAVPRQRQVPGASGGVRQNPFDSERPKWSTAGGGRYKTMCVRLCDGFYFPVSNAVSRRNFYRDAEMCQSQCDSETRLFFMTKSSGSIEKARDQSGLNYAELPNAFVYRKKLDRSCTCRAKPWSEAERNRHKRYAMIEAGTLDPKAAALDDKSEAEGEAAVAEQETNGEAGPAPGSRRPASASFETPSRAVVVRRPAPAAKKPLAQPTYGLGALFSGGGGSSSTKLKQYKKKFHWPDSDGS